MEQARFDLHGWKAIGRHLGRSERTCQRLAARDANPLPVARIGGIVGASSAALNRWVEHEVAGSGSGLRLVAS